ncbi:MAG: hypothetical protein ACFFB5_13925 [Promethearchaeota archaeon]
MRIVENLSIFCFGILKEKTLPSGFVLFQRSDEIIQLLTEIGMNPIDLVNKEQQEDIYQNQYIVIKCSIPDNCQDQLYISEITVTMKGVGILITPIDTYYTLEKEKQVEILLDESQRVELRLIEIMKEFGKILTTIKNITENDYTLYYDIKAKSKFEADNFLNIYNKDMVKFFKVLKEKSYPIADFSDNKVEPSLSGIISPKIIEDVEKMSHHMKELRKIPFPIRDFYVAHRTPEDVPLKEIQISISGINLESYCECLQILDEIIDGNEKSL